LDRVRKLALSREERILIVDAETGFRQILLDRLAQEGFLCLSAGSVAEALQLFEADPSAITAVVTDIYLPDHSGLELLEEANRRKWTCPIIFVTAYGNIEWAKKVIRAGAFEYYEKPVNLALLVQTVRQAIYTVTEYEGHERRETPRPKISLAVEGSGRDELTGLASHRYVLQKLPELRRECRKQGIPLSLCMFDIDKFRDMNSVRGLCACDRVLIEAAKRLKRLIRSDDLIGRYGGDEFLMLLPGADAKAADTLAKRIMDDLRNEPLWVDEAGIKLQACIGLVEVDHDENATDMEFIDRAIEAIYHAKLRGPEAIVVWTPRLSQERSSEAVGSERTTTQPDVESINIMMWRFRDLNRQLANVSLESLRVLVAAVEARDPYTKDHSVRVAAFSRCIAEEIDLPSRHVQVIHSAGLLHDIGKIGIADAILTKPGKLTSEEFELIRQHPAIGVTILEQTRFFTSELPLVKHHHERYDGKGYPDGLTGQSIPLGGRIIHVADATEAMLARRSYKEPQSLDYVIAQLREGRGRQFDPALVDLALPLIREGILERIWGPGQTGLPSDLADGDSAALTAEAAL